MKVKEISDALGKAYPEVLQEGYDNTGVQVLFPDDIVTGIYISLDIEKKVIDDAAGKACNLIVCHHPLMFRPVKKIISAEARSGMIIDLVRNGISLYALHTNYDKIMSGFLASELGFGSGRLLLKTGIYEDNITGFGSLSLLEEGIVFRDLLNEVKIKLAADYLLYAGDELGIIKSIAFVNGAGGSSIEKIINSSAPDCIITGDVGYHNIRYAIDSGTAVIDAGHFFTENIFKKMLAETVKDIMNDYEERINIFVSEVEKNPFKMYV